MTYYGFDAAGTGVTVDCYFPDFSFLGTDFYAASEVTGFYFFSVFDENEMNFDFGFVSAEI